MLKWQSSDSVACHFRVLQMQWSVHSRHCFLESAVLYCSWREGLPKREWRPVWRPASTQSYCFRSAGFTLRNPKLPSSQRDGGIHFIIRDGSIHFILRYASFFCDCVPCLRHQMTGRQGWSNTGNFGVQLQSTFIKPCCYYPLTSSTYPLNNPRTNGRTSAGAKVVQESLRGMVAGAG